jgi:hypothetical protein
VFTILPTITTPVTTRTIISLKLNAKFIPRIHDKSKKKISNCLFKDFGRKYVYFVNRKLIFLLLATTSREKSANKRLVIEQQSSWIARINDHSFEKLAPCRQLD